MLLNIQYVICIEYFKNVLCGGVSFSIFFQYILHVYISIVTVNEVCTIYGCK